MRYPGAEWKPISVNFQQGGNSPKFLVEHIMQGTLAGTDGWFRNPQAQVSAHFGVGKAGTVIQWVDTADVAWHAMAANGESIGVEHEGDSGETLTAAQLDADARLLAWAHEHHPIPLRLAHHPTFGAGLAYHALGGEAWGGHLACPGGPIIGQLPAILAQATRGVHVKATTGEHVSDGTKTLQAIAGEAHAVPSQVLRMTAEASGVFPADVAAWVNEIFDGKASPTAPVPKGLVLRTP